MTRPELNTRTVISPSLAPFTCPCIHPQEAATSLLPVFDEFLDSAPATQNFDSVRQSVVILMGSLAKHLSKTDPKIKAIVTKLIQALDTPSEQVGTNRWDASSEAELVFHDGSKMGLGSKWKTSH